MGLVVCFSDKMAPSSDINLVVLAASYSVGSGAKQVSYDSID